MENTQMAMTMVMMMISSMGEVTMMKYPLVVSLCTLIITEANCCSSSVASHFSTEKYRHFGLWASQSFLKLERNIIRERDTELQQTGED